MNIQFKSKIQKIILTGVLAALLAVLSQVSVPLPSGVPVTLQTFAVAMCGFMLGPVLGALSVAVYLALGAVGVPVFAGFTGGIGFFAGMTGGYLWSFLLMALLCGLGVKTRKRIFAILFGLLGLAVCHVCGALQFSLVTTTPVWESFLTASLPYLLKDVISVVLAYLAAEAVIFSLKKAGLVAE